MKNVFDNFNSRERSESIDSVVAHNRLLSMYSNNAWPITDINGLYANSDLDDIKYGDDAGISKLELVYAHPKERTCNYVPFPAIHYTPLSWLKSGVHFSDARIYRWTNYDLWKTILASM